MAAAVFDTEIDVVLVMLRELEATAVAPIIAATFLCALSYWKGLPPGAGVIIVPCACRVHLAPDNVVCHQCPGV